MHETSLPVFGALFALITGTAAGTLSVVSWTLLRESPFGRAALALSAALVVFIVYHAFVILTTDTPLVAKLLKSLVFTVVTVLVWILVWEQLHVTNVLQTDEPTDG